jgi:hypothetical protein
MDTADKILEILRSKRKDEIAKLKKLYKKMHSKPSGNTQAEFFKCLGASDMLDEMMISVMKLQK